MGNGFTDDSTTTGTCCVNDGIFTLNCRDAFSDGWHEGYVTIDGNNYCGDFLMGGLHNTQISFGNGQCPSGTSLTTLTIMTMEWASEVSWTVDESFACQGFGYQD